MSDGDGGEMHLMMAEDFAEMEDVIKKLSLCLDEYGAHQGTHYIRNDKIEPKGSFIELVDRAQKITARLEEESA